MRYELLKSPFPTEDIIEKFLYCRGMTPNNIKEYLNSTDECINSFYDLGEDNLSIAASALVSTIADNKSVLVVVDCDCDGYTSAAILINYLHRLYPYWVENHLEYYMHTGKQHGLSDCYEYALEKKFDLIICPDSSSNDYEYHKKIKEETQGNTKIIVLDHHEAEYISEDAIIINNQLCDYPNKFLSGAGVVWQFCRYIDNILDCNIADDFLDLVAIGLQGDMMSMLSIETKHLIWKGLKTSQIKNPFIYEIIKKNNFSLSKADYISYKGLAATPMGASFFIVPFINAIVRSGTIEEKDLIFRSMLEHKAFEKILSNKRGHAQGETERVVDQAMRTVTNVKNRQTRAQDAGMELLESLIEKNDMMKHKVLLFLLEPGQIDRNIAGLCANKIMAKYQRPVCVLTKVIEKDNISFQGSARGYDKSGITNFKDICAEGPGVMFAEGHQGAFGLSIDLGKYDVNDEGCMEMFGEPIYQFLDYTDNVLKDMQSEPMYYIDYDLDESEIDASSIILALSELNDFYGKDIDRPLVMMSFTVTSNNFTVMKSNTLKFTLPNGISIIKFNGTEEEIEQFTTKGAIKINAICKPNRNEWNGNISAQLLLEDYEIVTQSKYFF